jgi:hypothetical protein
MANRYAVATGNWNSASTWSATSGGAGGASVPGSSDIVYINANHTVTLTANASAFAVTHTAGTLTLSSFKLTVGSDYVSSGNNARTFNVNSGTLEVDATSTQYSPIDFSGTNFTFNAGTGDIIVNAIDDDFGTPVNIKTLSKTFNNMYVRIGLYNPGAVTVNITGNPSFNLLDLRSVSAAGHVVNIPVKEADSSSGSVITKKLIMIGWNSTYKLTISGGSTTPSVNGYNGLQITESSYGQFVNLIDSGNQGWSVRSVVIPFYVGANSTATGVTGMVLQDPPKISTLIDNLTIGSSSNANWAKFRYSNSSFPSSVTTGAKGGGYLFSNNNAIVSTNTFNVADSSIVIEIPPISSVTGFDEFTAFVGWGDDSFLLRLDGDASVYLGFGISVKSDGLRIRGKNFKGSITTGPTYVIPTSSATRFVKFICSTANIIQASISSDGITYSATSFYFDPTSGSSQPQNMDYLKSSRVYVSNYLTSNVVLGSINPVLNQVPATVLISPSNATVLNTQTPVLTFKATDPEGETVTYQVQIADNTGFSSPHTDALSSAGTGFSGSDPYASNTNVTFTLQTNLSNGGLTYYWRVRAKDPAGSNSWGAWTDPRTLITDALPPTVTTGTSSNITASGATIAGNVTATNGANVTERGIVYATTSNPTTSSSKSASGTGTGSFTANLVGLSSNTTYNYRAYAVNSKGTSYGSNQTFITQPDPAQLAITSIYDTTFNTTKVDSTVTQTDGATITERGVVYATSSNPTTGNNKVANGSGTGNYTTTLTGLTGSTSYYVRAYAINSVGTSYSAQTTFNTQQTPSAPTVTTGASSQITDITARLSGEATLDGTQPVTERGVVFSETSNPTTLDRKAIATTSGLGQFTATATGLDPDTTYHYRAYGINSIGTGYGSDQTFATLAPFTSDEGDGFWTWSPSASDANISRSQSTQSYFSVNLPLQDLGLEDGKTYTFYYKEATTVLGEALVKLQRYDGITKLQDTIAPDTPYTFTYDEDLIHWNIRLFVTQADVESENVSATFSEMYLAEEPDFTGYVPFVANGITEVKIENNWLLDSRRTEVIQSIFDEVNGESWHPFNIETEGLGWYEIGDRITLSGDDERPVVVWNSKLTINGGIKENLSAVTPDLTETNYSKAGKLGGLWKRTEIAVDKNRQEIESVVEDIYAYDGVINTKFSQIEQDVNEVRTTIQGSGGVNLVKNSVMYAFDNDGLPDSWEVTGTGSLVIQASPESLSAGAVAGNAFTLSDKTVTQRVTVRKDVDFILEDDKTFYSFSAKVKKNVVGTAYITLTNRNETLTIDLPDQEGYYWDTVKIEEILPKDDHYVIEVHSDDDADLQVTDLMLAPGQTQREWTQSNGEVMNASVAITVDGMTIRSPQFPNDYTKIDALGLEVHSKEAGGARVFGFNKDETNVSKLRADEQITMPPMRIVPIEYGSYKGIAFTPSEEN